VKRKTLTQSINIYKYHLLLTNPRDALHHIKRAASKGGRSV